MIEIKEAGYNRLFLFVASYLLNLPKSSQILNDFFIQFSFKLIID